MRGTKITTSYKRISLKETQSFLASVKDKNESFKVLLNGNKNISNKGDTFTFNSLQTKFHDNSGNLKKLNFYETNKIISETQADIFLKEQNDVSSIRHLMKIKIIWMTATDLLL